MSTGKSPGPWRLESMEMFSADDGPGHRVVDANGDTVCDNQRYYPEAVSLEDATLIAAAPELLAAVEYALTGIGLTGGFTSTAIKKLQAAAAKAHAR